MTRTSYQTQLETLREDVLAMSDRVCERLRLALQALASKDETLAEEIITGDHEINRLYLDLERECIDLIALQQPVAGDLRFVASSFKIVTDLERIGDLATNLAGYAIDAERDRYPEIDLMGLGAEAVEIVEDAMAAYAAEDGEATREIATRDDAIDARCEEASAIVVRNLLASDGDEDVFEDVSRLLLTIRDLERVADHAVNVAARTLYMVENDDELIY